MSILGGKLLRRLARRSRNGTGMGGKRTGTDRGWVKQEEGEWGVGGR